MLEPVKKRVLVSLSQESLDTLRYIAGSKARRDPFYRQRDLEALVRLLARDLSDVLDKESDDGQR